MSYLCLYSFAMIWDWSVYSASFPGYAGATALVGASLVAQLVKNLPVMQETWVWFPGEGKGYPLQYSGRENSMDCIVHEVAKSQAQLRDFHSLTALVEGMAGHGRVTARTRCKNKPEQGARASVFNGYHCSQCSLLPWSVCVSTLLKLCVNLEIRVCW